LNRNFTESKKWPRFDKNRWSRLVKLGGHATQNSVATLRKNMQLEKIASVLLLPSHACNP
ncbi:MAG: hypothetical protein ACI9SP_003818, partial [Arenicella sp.]